MALHRRVAEDPTPTHPLRPVRVIDIADEWGAYAGRLLADLGADVIRVVPPHGDTVRSRDPLIAAGDGAAGGGKVSAFGLFVNVNKRLVFLDLRDAEDRVQFLDLLATADVLLDSWRPGEAQQLDLARDVIAAHAPGLVRVAITPYGVEGPWSARAATDLTTLASGGLLSLGGYPDAEPVAAHGDQSLLAGSIFGAVAALLGLVERQLDGVARSFDVSAQEVIAGALEDAIPQYDLTGRVRRRTGDRPREAGTGIYACLDGHVSMVAGRLGTARAWQALTEWLVETGTAGAPELTEERWQSFPYRQRPEAIERFGEIFLRFTSRQTKRDLYLEAQRRSIALAPVNDVSDLFSDPQLAARGFFRSIVHPDSDAPATLPGRPYRMGTEADVVFGVAPEPRIDADAALGAADAVLAAGGSSGASCGRES
jgi:benzylsuccinate CoA-transferase BbsE subunit